MLEPHAAEIRQELAAARLAALHRSAQHLPAGPLRRAVGSGLVRLGLRLGYEGSVPPLVSQPSHRGGGPRRGLLLDVTAAASLRTSVTRT